MDLIKTINLFTRRQKIDGNSIKLSHYIFIIPCSHSVEGYKFFTVIWFVVVLKVNLLFCWFYFLKIAGKLIRTMVNNIYFVIFDQHPILPDYDI